MPYRTAEKIDQPIEKNLNQILNELPLVDRTQAKITLKIASIRDECSDLYAEAFDRFFPGAMILKDLIRSIGGSMIYSKLVTRREMAESELFKKYNSSSTKTR